MGTEQLEDEVRNLPPSDDRTRRQHILAVVADAALDVAVYDRQDDSESLPLGAIEEAIEAGEVTVAEMAEVFRFRLLKELAFERRG